jgi:hypothetical protein
MLLLSAFAMVQQGAVWQTRYEGVLLPTSDPAPDLVLAAEVTAFTNRLAGPPMHMLVTNAVTFQGRQRLQPSEASVFDDVISQLQPPSTNRTGGPTITHGFVVEGLVR